MVRSVSACVAGAMGHGDPQVDALPEVRDVEDVLTCHSLPAVQGVPMLSHGQKIPVSQDVQSFSWLAYVQNIWATQEEEKTRALPDVRNTALVPDVRNTALLPDARSSLPPHGITPCSRGLQPPSFRCRRWLCLHGFLPKMLVLLGILLIVCPALGLKCRSYETISMGASGHHAIRHSRSHRHSHRSQALGEIVPRLDMEVEVGQELEVYCNFNSSELANANVSFRTLSRQAGYETLDVERVNASTIKTTLSRSAPDEFKLSCSYREDGSNKWTTACLKNVDFGYAPLPLEDFGCVSPNWSYLNCSWRRPLNPINTNYTFYFFVRNLVQLSPIEGVSQRQNWFKLESDRNYGTRANVTILITASNSLGVRNFTHDVDVYSVVVPSPPPWVNATEVGVAGASLTWQLDHRMDAFPAPLLQELAWRVLPSFSWTKTVSPATYVEVTTPAGAVEKHVYHAHVPLPYKHVPYELRVRLHTGQGPVRDDFWSQPAFVRVTTLSARPELNVSVDPSSYETHDYIESRDVFVYWRQLDPLHENGPDFHYRVLATADPPAASPSPSPVIAYRTYAKFPQMAKNVSYSFEITAVNDVGAAPAHSVVLVPPTSLTPDVPEVFTVIKYKTEQDRLLYRLMWKPPLQLGTEHSPVGTDPVVSYTFFWCPKPTFDLRCEEDLQWESTGQNLESYRVRDQNLHHSLGAGALGLLYERNMTDLPQNRQFGIAAIAASGMSSGIKWATCSVPYDDSPPAPRAPSADCLSSRSVKLSWNFECPDKSAVPLYVRISFCETGPAASPDAARCDTNVTVEERPLTGPAVIDGLRPSSTVMFYLSVVSVVGTSRDSVPVRLTLPEDVPEGPPQSLAVTSRTNTSLTLQWTSPLDVTTNGQLVAYQVTTSPPSGVVRVAGRDTQVVLRDLRPYQAYQVLVVACTRAGCAVNHSAVAGATTRPGLPEKVEQLSVSRRDGRMSWAYTPDLCHSASCSFDVIVVNNDTVHSYTGIREHALSLRGLNLTCVSGQPLNVSVRATGVDDLGAPLHGPWHVKEEPCVVSVVTSLEWWIVAIVVAVGILITVAIFVVTKCGLSAIREIMTAPNLPDFKSGDLKSIGEKKVKPDLPPTGPASSQQALFNPAYTSLHLPSPVTRCPPQQDLFDEGKRMPLLSQSSVNSETEGPEEASERHERNPSGDSSRGGSSEADSALASTAEAQDSASQQDSASASSQDSAHSSLRQGRDLWPPVGTVRQRSPGPYVLHGEHDGDLE
ncbi:cytokine receptor [Hyalella azteca]|uniref:Cytokine receptor n=1 Tax=Hyalella azteca TaxID=294128 RepID=A0A8B7PAN0_HYAAZ|nr:cytokine receptor [Hyalella azteca]